MTPNKPETNKGKKGGEGGSGRPAYTCTDCGNVHIIGQKPCQSHGGSKENGAGGGYVGIDHKKTKVTFPMTASIEEKLDKKFGSAIRNHHDNGTLFTKEFKKEFLGILSTHYIERSKVEKGIRDGHIYLKNNIIDIIELPRLERTRKVFRIETLERLGFDASDLRSELKEENEG